MKSGFVAILGRPNVGKSTILNLLLDEKVSIVTQKSQTTRNNIKGIYNAPEVQIVFIDTPGIHKPEQKLGECMNKSALSSISDADAAVLVVDASKSFGKGDTYLVENLSINVPLFIVLNKIDLTHIDLVMKLKSIYSERYPKATIIEMSAIRGFNKDLLLESLIKVLPEGPQYYETNLVSDSPESFMVGEIIREKALKLLRDEVPHSIMVTVDKTEFKKESVIIDASIIVESPSQKGIVIGAAGKMIKRIGTLAREDIEDMYKKKVYLELFVKVKDKWRDKADALKEFGFAKK